MIPAFCAIINARRLDVARPPRRIVRQFASTRQSVLESTCRRKDAERIDANARATLFVLQCKWIKRMEMECSCGHSNAVGIAYCEACGSKLFVSASNTGIRCVHCGREFTLEETVWCMCETETPTYVCPHCERCACSIVTP